MNPVVWDGLKGCYWPFSAGHADESYWSNPMQSLVRTNQVTCQVECKRMVK
jgi:hypothetical protein